MKTLDCNLIMPMDGNSSNLQRPQHRYPRRYININILCYMCIYIYMYMVVDQNSFIPERPFFANKKITFAKLSRTPCLSFAGPMLANNTSYEDSLTTCQITPENHGSLLGSLLKHAASITESLLRTDFFLQNLLAHPLQHAL